MKKKTFNLLLIIITSVIAISCQKKQEKISISDNKKLDNIISTIGKFHNNSLNLAGERIFLLNSKSQKNKTNGLTSSIPLPPYEIEEGVDVPMTTILQNVLNSMENIPEYSNLHLENDPQLITKLEAASADFSITGFYNQWTTAVNEPVLNNFLTARERDLINQILIIFSDSHGPHRVPYNIHANMISRFEALKNQHANTVWQENEGELFLGTLEIAMSSTDYWFSANSQTQLSNTVNPNLELFKKSNNNGKIMKSNFLAAARDPLAQTSIPLFIEADALGYILGWVNAVYRDAVSPGGLQSSGQWKRIGSGIAGGAGMSIGKMKIFREYQLAPGIGIGDIPIAP